MNSKYNSKIADDVLIYDDVKLGNNVTIGKGAIIYPNVEIKDNTFIGPYTIVGEPVINYYTEPNSHNFEKTIIGNNCVIRSHNIIYENVCIGDNLQTGANVIIREKTEIGNNCSIGTSSELLTQIKMGNYVRIHSNVFICEFTQIEDYVWIYPHVILTNDKYPPMGDLLGPKIREYAQIAAGAIILPGIEIGKNALVSAGAIVISDIPEFALYMGYSAQNKGNIKDIRDKNGNKIYPWKKYLKDNKGYPWQE